MATETGDFYEEDEPIEDVLAAWETSPKGFTAARRRGINLVLEVDGEFRAATVGQTMMVSSLDLRPERPMLATS